MRALAGKLLRIVLSLFVLLAVMAGVTWTLLHNEGMTSRIVPLLPMVTVLNPSGALLGDFKASRIDIALPRGGFVTVLDPVWTGLEVWPASGVLWRVAVKADALSARRVDVKWVAKPPSGKPREPLADLDLPLSVRIGRVQVAEAHSHYWGASPLRVVDGSVALQVPVGVAGVVGPGSHEHVVKLASVAWEGWRASGDVRVATRGKMPIAATLQLQGSPSAEALTTALADLKVNGPLARLLVTGQMRFSQGQAVARGQLDVDAEVAPLDAWPLARLQAVAKGLDIANLFAGMPTSDLSGDVLIEPVATQDLQARLNLRNARAGAWDEGLLPVRELKGRISLLGARGAQTMAATLQDGVLDVAAQLPSVGQSAPGSLTLKGGWGASRTLRADWQGLMPGALHRAAPPLQVRGSLAVKPKWQGGLSQLARTTADVSGQVQGLYGQAFAMDARKARGASKTPASALAPATSVPISMSFSGGYGPGHIHVKQWRMQAQEAQAELKDSLFRWGGTQPWQVKASVSVQAFDPRVWFPWPAAVTGANRISGKVDASVNGDWRGQIEAHVAPSVIGGVPVQGHVAWQSPPTRQQMSAVIDLDAGGNAFNLKAELPWRRDAQGAMRLGDGAVWQGRIQAPALQNLQAVAPLLGATRISGVIDAEGSAKGLWPGLATQGHLSVSRFQWDARGGQLFKLDAAKADWQLDTRAPDALVRVRLDLAKAQAGGATIEQAVWSVDGTLKAHRARMVAELTQQIGKQRKPTAIHFETAVQGAMLGDGRTGALTSWDGQVEQLLLRTVGLTPHVLLHAQPFKVQSRWSGDARSLVVSPASLNMLGVGMELRSLTWQTASTMLDPIGEVHADVRLTPLNLSTVLASWQPLAGWGGDLQLTGKLTLHHTLAQAWQVDAEVSRQSGDLSLAEPTIEGSVVQRLGIRQAKVTLQSRDGVWLLNEQFEGRLFGEFTGRQTVSVSDPRQLPSAADALAGDVNMQIRNLRPWGSWLPAGWRLSGQMQAQARLSGTLGAPQYAGTVEGDGLGLGQALLGVNITDGILKMRLDGDHLYLDRLEARSGSQGGLMSATGSVSMVDTPTMQLSIKADRFGLLQRVDRRVMVSGEVNGVAAGEDIKIDGRVLVDEGLIDISRSDAPTVGDDVYVTNRPGETDEKDDDESASGGTTPNRKVIANIDVDLGRKLRLRGRGLDAFLTGALRVSSPANRASIRGTINVVDGTYAAYGQKLLIERGSVAFTGAIENPRLDILAMRAQSPTAASTDVKVGVNITGTAQDPRVKLYSDPAMSETEKLSWLVLGRAPTGLGGADIGLLQTAAVALLSGEGSSPSDNLVGMLGLDELSVRQTDGAVRDTVVNVGKQVSKFWYVGYERNLNATSGNWQVIYRLAQRFTVRAQTGDDNAVDFIWSWRWD